jgi:hypothetical protein
LDIHTDYTIFFLQLNRKNETKFTSRIFSLKLSKPEFSEFLDSFFESYAMSVRKVFDEDHEICKLIPRESWSIEPLKYPSELEEKINLFRQMCRESFEFKGKNHF